jgi:hypothetical protein
MILRQTPGAGGEGTSGNAQSTSWLYSESQVIPFFREDKQSSLASRIKILASSG